MVLLWLTFKAEDFWFALVLASGLAIAFGYSVWPATKAEAAPQQNRRFCYARLLAIGLL